MVPVEDLVDSASFTLNDKRTPQELVTLWTARNCKALNCASTIRSLERRTSQHLVSTSIMVKLINLVKGPEEVTEGTTAVEVEAVEAAVPQVGHTEMIVHPTITDRVSVNVLPTQSTSEITMNDPTIERINTMTLRHHEERSATGKIVTTKIDTIVNESTIVQDTMNVNEDTRERRRLLLTDMKSEIVIPQWASQDHRADLQAHGHQDQDIKRRC